MGTDIYAFVEYQPIIDYEAFCQIYLSRNYELFGLMANVRYDPDALWGIKPISEPKGLPENISRTAKEEYDKIAAGDESYLDVEELELLHTKYLSIPPNPNDIHPDHNETVDYVELIAIIDMMKVLDKVSVGKSRLVFWFD